MKMRVALSRVIGAAHSPSAPIHVSTQFERISLYTIISLDARKLKQAEENTFLIVSEFLFQIIELQE